MPSSTAAVDPLLYSSLGEGETLRLFLAGEWAHAADEVSFQSENPSTGRPWVRVVEAGPADVDRAVQAAARALSGAWGRVNAADRGRVLWRIAELVDRHRDELAQLESRDNGKAIREEDLDALAGCPLDAVMPPALADEEGLLREARTGRQLWFSGKLLIHPAQIEPVRRVFRSSELEWSRRVLSTRAQERGGVGVHVIDGKMVDAPVLAQAERILARAH